MHTYNPAQVINGTFVPWVSWGVTTAQEVRIAQTETVRTQQPRTRAAQAGRATIAEIAKADPAHVIICKPAPVTAETLTETAQEYEKIIHPILGEFTDPLLYWQNRDPSPAWMFESYKAGSKKPTRDDPRWASIPYHRAITGATVTACDYSKKTRGVLVTIDNLETIASRDYNLISNLGKFSSKDKGYKMTLKTFAEYRHKAVNG